MQRMLHQSLKVQKELEKDGYSLVIYDSYRPRRAVEHFIQWAKYSYMSL